MKDIGAIFDIRTMDSEIERKNNKSDSSYRFYSLCREILLDIIENIKSDNKVALLPAYTCSTVINPFIQKGWFIVYYKINKDLTIDCDNIIEKAKEFSPEIVLFHPYYGTDLEEAEVNALIQVKKYAKFIIEDATQCLYSLKKYDFVDFKVCSLRKWYPIPDGAFLDTGFSMSDSYLNENSLFIVNQLDAMYLRNVYFQTNDETIKKISIRLHKLANTEASKTIVSHRISSYSKIVLDNIDVENCKNRRFENFVFLDSQLKESDSIYKVIKKYRVGSAPLYFPVYVADREKIQKELAARHVYAPILWPLYETKMLIDESISYIYEHILLIPCDQRYDLTDMAFVVRLLNEASKK